MLNKIRNVITLLVTAAVILSPLLANSKITKCQDSSGKWYYGTNASYNCDTTKEVTSLNQSGVKVGKVAGQLTPEELLVQAKARAAEQDRLMKANFEKAERERIMMVYQTEGDIHRAKDKQLTAVNQKIVQHENYVAALQKQKELQESKKAATKNAATIKKIDAKIAVIDKKSSTSLNKIEKLNQKLINDENKFNLELDKFLKYKKQ